MPKIYSESPFTKGIYNKIMNKIQRKAPLGHGETIVRKWYSGETIHTGQIYATKILPNGNILTRVTTVASGIDAIVNDTSVMSSSGEILKNCYSLIWQIKKENPAKGLMYSKQVLPNGNLKTNIMMSVKNDATIITDTRVKTTKGKLLKAYFCIRGPKYTVTDSNGEVLREYEPTKLYANNIHDVRIAVTKEKSLNPEMKFLT